MPSYSEIRVALLQIGVDIANQQSVEKLNANLEWLDETRRRCERWQTNLRQIAIGGVVAFLGGIFAYIISWVTSHGMFGLH